MKATFTRRITPRAVVMTTRKLAAGAALALAGCATPGPLHVYSLSDASAPTIADLGAERAAPTPSFNESADQVIGFAYDPFTDHFFLRLAPGNRFRVVDRPARAIKREFKLDDLPATGGGDLAIRPRDGHVFALLPGRAAFGEFTRYGEFVRNVELRGPAAAAGIAYDASGDRLFILAQTNPARITVHEMTGAQLTTISLDRAVAPGGLAFDPELREFYAALAGNAAVGVFGEDGRLRRELPLKARFFDVGPRSFLRMF